MAYNTPESVADYLSRFQMQVTERTKGTFSPMHVKYSLALKMGSSSFETTFQSNPNVHGEPTVTQVFGILPGADDGGYSLSGEAKEAALSRFALPENRKAALNMIRKLNESRDSNDNAL